MMARQIPPAAVLFSAEFKTAFEGHGRVSGCFTVLMRIFFLFVSFMNVRFNTLPTYLG